MINKYPHPDDIIEDSKWHNAWIEWYDSLDEAKLRIKEEKT